MRAGPEIGNQILVRLLRIPYPYPYKSMPLDDRIGLRANALVGALARVGHFNRPTLGVEEQTVITAADVVAFFNPHRQGQEPVWTGVVQGNDATVEFAEKHDRFAANRPRERRAIDLVIPTGGIPLVTNENNALPYDLSLASTAIILQHA